VQKNLRFAFILNPSADRKRAAVAEQWLKKMLDEHFPDSVLLVSESEKDAIRLARESATTFDAVIACGGDGTIQEVATGLAGQNATMGIIPMGSGNDFVKSAGISLNREKAILQLKTAKSLAVDLVHFNTESHSGVSMNTIGIGFDGMVNHETKKIKRFKGALVYLIAILKSASNMKPLHLKCTIDGEVIEEKLLMLTIANGKTEGGNFRIAPNASISDGWLDIVMIKPISTIGLFLRLLLFTIGQQHRSSKIKLLKCREISVESEDDMPVHADGEHVGLNIHKLHAKIEFDGVHLLVPG